MQNIFACRAFLSQLKEALQPNRVTGTERGKRGTKRPTLLRWRVGQQFEFEQLQRYRCVIGHRELVRKGKSINKTNKKYKNTQKKYKNAKKELLVRVPNKGKEGK